LHVKSAEGGQVPLNSHHPSRRDDGAAVDRAPGTVPGGHAVVRPRAGRLAGDAVRAVEESSKRPACRSASAAASRAPRRPSAPRWRTSRCSSSRR
jgi:hypothetical protein